MATAPSDRRHQAADALTALGAALLPLLGRGLPLDEIPTPEVATGRLILAGLFAGALLLDRRAPRHEAARWPLLGLLAVGLLSLLPRSGPVVIVADGPSLGVRLPADLEAGLRELARLALIGLAAAAAARARPSWVLGGLVAGGTVIALLGAQSWLTQARQGDPTFRIMVGFVSPNQLAGYLLAVWPPAVVLPLLARADSAAVAWLERQQVTAPLTKLRVIACLPAVVIIAALALTGSRGGILGLLAAALAAAVGLARGGRARAALPVLGGLLLVGLLLLAGPMRTRLVLAAAQTHSLLFRQLTWAGTVDLIRDLPLLGCGLGGWMLTYPLFARAGYTFHAHNGFLQSAAEAGLGALAAMLALFGAWLRTGWRLAVDDGSQRLLGVSLLSAAAGVAATCAFDSPWSVTAVPAALAMLAACLSPDGQPPRRRWPAPVGVGLLLVFLLLDASAERARAAAAGHAAHQAFGSARDALRTARDRRPWGTAAIEQQAGYEAARGDAAAAEALYRQAMARRTTSSRIRYRLAQLLAETGRPEEAMALSREAVSLSPLHLQGYLQRGRLEEAVGDPARARATYAELDRLAESPALRDAAPVQKSEYLFEPTQALALMRLGELAAEAGDTDVARDAFERAAADFALYEKTFAQQEALLRGLDAPTRREILALQGLRDDERIEFADQAALAASRLDQLGD